MLQAESKFNPKSLSFLILCSGLLLLLTISQAAYSQKKDSVIQTSRVDTIPLKISKDSITSPVDYKAEDSMVLDVDAKKIFLFGKTEVKYEDIVLSAPRIEFNQQTQYVLAKMTRDTSGLVMGMAKLKQGETVTVSDSLSFNFKSQKGLTYSSFFQQDELFNFAEKVKKLIVKRFLQVKADLLPVIWIHPILPFGSVRPNS